mgnify:CR=1 FL=1
MAKPDDINSWDELAKLATPKLKDLAREDTPLLAVAAMEKDDLVVALAKLYGFEKPQKAKNQGVIKKLKAQAKTVKQERDVILAKPPAERDKKKLAGARQQIRKLKRQMRRQARVG